MRAGIIGYGSIGKRHVANLISLGIRDIVLYREKSSGNDQGLVEISNFEEFINNKFDFILLSNPTSFHFKFLKDLVVNNQNILAEKPLVKSLEEAAALDSLLNNYTGIGMVAYNTRFHPCIREVKSLIKKNMIGRPLYARFYLGQYLPDWRPAIDYRESVSAKKSLGGGVASELIHEVDLAIEFFGEPTGIVRSVITKVSDLQIETEDTADFLYRSQTNVVVAIHTDYFYRGYKRSFEIVGTEANIFCDLYAAKISITGNNNSVLLEKDFPNFQRNDMYTSLMKYFTECVINKKQPKPSLAEGLISVKMVEEAKIKNEINE